MAERCQLQTRRSWRNLALTQFNRQTGKEIYLLDLDHAGANLETPFSLSLEYPVEFSFVLPGAPGEIKVSGRVTWKQQLTRRREDIICGCNFIRLAGIWIDCRTINSRTLKR